MRRFVVVGLLVTAFVACATTEDPAPTRSPGSDASGGGDGSTKADGGTSPGTDSGTENEGGTSDAATKDSAATDGSTLDAAGDAPADVKTDTAAADSGDAGCPGTTVNPTCAPPAGNFAFCGIATATSEYGSSYAAAKANDDDLNTSWYSDSAACPAGVCPGTTIRWEVELNTPRTIGRIKLFGNRDFPSDYDVLTARFELLDGSGVGVYGADVTTSRGTEPNGDVDHVVPGTRTCVKKIRVIVKTSETTGNDGPGVAELQAFAN